jgi:RNA polymerase sigma-70 factor (ECF subfamily)
LERSDPSDLELVRCACDGHDQSFHALVDRHSKDLFRAALSMSHNRADAEDLLQETFVGAYRGLKNFQGRSSVKTWLLQILTRKAATAWNRGKNARRTLSLSTTSGEDGHDNSSAAAAGAMQSANGEARTSSVEQRLDVMQVLGSLSAPHREILVLREIRQLSYDEIAQVLEVPRGTVESRLSRARAEFRQRFGGYGD